MINVLAIFSGVAANREKLHCLTLDQLLWGFEPRITDLQSGHASKRAFFW
jgi:hypothetical protein